MVPRRIREVLVAVPPGSVQASTQYAAFPEEHAVPTGVLCRYRQFQLLRGRSAQQNDPVM
jgi:hypothetical protein